MYQVAEGECEHEYFIVDVKGTVQLTEVCEPLKYEHCCVYCIVEGAVQLKEVCGGQTSQAYLAF